MGVIFISTFAYESSHTTRRTRFDESFRLSKDMFLENFSCFIGQSKITCDRKEERETTCRTVHVHTHVQNMYLYTHTNTWTMNPTLCRTLSVSVLSSSFSDRLLHPECVKEPYRRSYLPAAVGLYTQHCSTFLLL